MRMLLVADLPRHHQILVRTPVNSKAKKGNGKKSKNKVSKEYPGMTL